MTVPLLSKLFQQRMNDFARACRRRWGNTATAELIKACEAYARTFKRFHPEHAGATYNVEEAVRAFTSARRQRPAGAQQRLVS
jgi:hypothetical protein